jgi:hypothetical protein
MSSVMYAYKLAPQARLRLAGSVFPREIHVHANGHAVALYDGHGDVHFPSLYSVLDHHDLGQRDLESADPWIPPS